MTDDGTTQSHAWPLHDAQAALVQRTVRAGLWLGAAAALVAATLHWLDPLADPVHRVVPPVLGLGLALLALRQGRRPEAMASTLWLAWWLAIAGLAVPTWWFLARSLRSGELLVELLPPVGAALPPVLVGMALFARPRVAMTATLVAWAAVALPVLAYLGAHLPQLWTPRGLDLVLALGPGALFVPLLVPLLRGMERRFHALHREGERLQALAERDVLIGLYNRRAGERFLSTLLAHARDDASLVLFDIDHFKRINDRHGHPAGDAVLIEVGRRCSTQLRADDIFARWGGEEFLVVLPGIALAEGAARAERLRAAIGAEPIGAAGWVTASFGVTAIRVGDTLAEVVQRADEALYRAKANGRNRVETALPA
jgi:diguanylate cyclase (GGDEF)-like protein